MSQVQKAAVGPALAKPCKHCGKPVSVAWTSMLVALPLLVSIVVAPFLWPSPVAWLLPLACFVLYLAVHAFKVPLVARGA
jgi:hypothetical protein